MKTIETKIRINATAEQVWNTLVEVKQYPLWSSGFLINGSIGLSEQLLVTVKLDNKKPMQFKPKIIDFKDKQQFSWLGKLFNINGLFTGKHYFIVNPLSDSECELIHGEIFSGLLLPLLWPMIGKKTEQSFIRFNDELSAYLANK